MKTNNYKNQLILILLTLSFNCFSQTNLQFNRVVFQSGSLTGSNYYQTTSFTVPVGKVWKLEKYTRNKLYVNNNLIQDTYYSEAGGGGYPVPVTIDNSPLWLNEGDTIYFIFSYGCCNPVNVSWYFSALEFNKN